MIYKEICMRKIFSILLVLIFVFSLVGCNQDKTTSSDFKTQQETITETESSSAEETTDNQLKTGEDKVIYESEDGNKIIFQGSETVEESDGNLLTPRTQTDIIKQDGLQFNATLRNKKGYTFGGVVNLNESQTLSVHKNEVEVARVSYVSAEQAYRMTKDPTIYELINEGKFNGATHKIYRNLKLEETLIISLATIDGVDGSFLITTHDEEGMIYDICELITYDNFS